MWDRKELKEKGKAAFKANYWKCVLVGLLLVLFATGTGASAGRSSTNSMNAVNNQNSVVVVTDGTTTYAVDGQTAAEVQNAIEESEFMAAMQDPAFQLAVRSMAAAMGAVLLAAGAKGKRYALPNSRVMIHQPSGGAEGKASDILISAEEIRKCRASLNEILARHTGKDIATVERDTDRDFFLSADEAKAIEERAKAEGVNVIDIARDALLGK